ncbi:MAG: SufD family Fe-S cluster assembly protein [Rikenellaceae bacterium]
MQHILQAINDLGFAVVSQPESVVSSGSTAQFSAVNPSDFRLRVEDGATLDLVMVHGASDKTSIIISLGRGAKLNLVQLYNGTAPIEMVVNQSEDSAVEAVAVSLGSNSVTYNMQLCDVNAHCEVNTLQMGAQIDNNSLVINMRHKSPDCSSGSLSKCIAAGESNLHFEGLVYVAHDAQRTAAEQNCRCIELSDTAHIVAQPQLEIYADDVKCSHGATMGQTDTEAIFYMRQRGLSEAQARRVQMEGFIADVVGRCSISNMSEILGDIVFQKLEIM